MGFDMALIRLKTGARMARRGWNGKGMFVRHIDAGGVVGGRRMAPFLEFATAQGDLVPWVASQTDLLADDWFEV
jgi:hypothetical protein